MSVNMKFKVGDKVTIKENFRDFGSSNVTRILEKYMGWILTVERITVYGELKIKGIREGRSFMASRFILVGDFLTEEEFSV